MLSKSLKLTQNLRDNIDEISQNITLCEKLPVKAQEIESLINSLDIMESEIADIQKMLSDKQKRLKKLSESKLKSSNINDDLLYTKEDYSTTESFMTENFTDKKLKNQAFIGYIKDSFDGNGIEIIIKSYVEEHNKDLIGLKSKSDFRLIFPSSYQ